MSSKMTPVDAIWNRACGENPLRSLLGDRALADMLYAHGLVMNGGVLHAIECLTAIELVEARLGYEYFGLDAVASLLDRAQSIFESGKSLGTDELRLNQQYTKLIPSDSALGERLEKRLKANPLDFAPIPAQ